MSFALNEVEATARKAARGAGLSWGMAEEAGGAARWLCAQGLDGVATLLAVLERVDGRDPAGLGPAALAGDWRADPGPLCPLRAGAALADSAPLWAAEGEKRLADAIVPAMLLPFAGLAARALGCPVTLEWAGVRAVTDGATLDLAASAPAALLADAGLVTVVAGGRVTAPRPRQTRAHPIAADLAALDAYAQRTYAPATEASRLHGAGAGLSDND